MRGVLSAAFLALLASWQHVDAKCIRSPKPIVDLGYEVHEASVNNTGDYYIFSNIPYAQPPVGELRFKKPRRFPKSDGGKYSVVNKGETYTQCFQAYPGWVLAEEASASSTSNESDASPPLGAYSNPQSTESCLHLDVYVPSHIFEKGKHAKAPVLVWIHGGGFVFGSKSSSGNPATLISRAEFGQNHEGLVVVSINYRLGMFGWLSGGEDATPNIGLHDQRAALVWIQENIHQFGGDGNHVTIMGESAGASSILHQITAYGGEEGRVPFHQAILQSPAFQFNIDFAAGFDATMLAASGLTNSSVTSVEQLRRINDSATLAAINQAAVYGAPQGDFTFGPGPDGTFVPKLPQVLLHEGGFDHEVGVMASHCSNESVTFAPQIGTEEELRAALEVSFPEASPSTLTTLLTDVYPPPSDLTPWKTEFARTVQLVSEVFFACATAYLAEAKGNKTHNYVFAFPPGYHAEDVPYVFFNGDTTTLDDGFPVKARLANALQDYIVAFAREGDPNANRGGLPHFPVYGQQSTVLDLAVDGIATAVDDMRNPRCAWWMDAMVKGLV